MAGGVRYDVPDLRKHQKFFDCCVAAHGVSFTVIDVQTPCPEFELSIIGGNSPNFGCHDNIPIFTILVRGDLLSPDRFVRGSVDV